LVSKKVEKRRVKRKLKVRGKIHGTETRPRLSIFRSARHIYVQAINDDIGKTIAEVSTLSEELSSSLDGLKKIAAAKEVGKLVSKRLKIMGIESVVFDRGRFLYHGRVRALAEAARELGLKF
jgi:large subunit ribosomal protein L18